MQFALLEAILGRDWGLIVYPILLSSLPLSGSSPGMTVILMAGALSLNSTTQSINQSINQNCFGGKMMAFITVPIQVKPLICHKP